MALSKSKSLDLGNKEQTKPDSHLERNPHLGRLAAQLAHDLNLPLASILAYAEELIDLAQERYGLDGFKQIADYIQIIQAEAHHCVEIVDKMLAYAKGLEIQLEIVDLRQLISDCIKQLSLKIDSKLISVQTEFDPRVAYVTTDPTGLRQVVMNVLVNASDAIEKEGQIIVRTRGQREAIVLEISDNGTGIDKAILPKIFDPFFTTKRASKGTGLGLAICQGILQTLKGKITVDSEQGVGTTVSISLPKKFKAILA